MVARGIDPIDAAKAEKQVIATNAVWTVTAAAEEYIKVMEVDWKTQRYATQLRQRMKTYVAPVIGDMPIADVGIHEAEQVLTPIWSTIRPTAERIRHHLEGVVNWAITKGHRANDNNPFETKRLQFVLSFTKRKVTSRAALCHTQAPALMAELRGTEGIKSLALQFILLTAVRVGDIVGGGKHDSVPMCWAHVDMVEKSWRIPDTKMGHEHVVPLSDAAIAILVQMQQYRDVSSDFVFPGAVRGTVISDATLRYLLGDMGYAGQQTVHGCRSLFKTWAEEDTSGYDIRVIEAALAHSKQGVIAAYHRGSYLRKRAQLMAAWADYLNGEAVGLGNNVTALRA